MALRYNINSPTVASEVIDGEAVIMHLKSGKYFSAAASGGVIWAGVEDHLFVDQILDRLLAQYAVPVDEARAALDGFVTELLNNELVREVNDDVREQITPVPAIGMKLNFTAPVLNVYSDMQDLLLLDPIHDVDEVGWPVAASNPKD